MSDTFKLTGRYLIKPPPQSTQLSADFTVDAEINEKLVLSKKNAEVYTLEADAAETIDFADIVNAALVIVKTTAPVVARVTSGVGTSQAFTIDTLLVLMTPETPITALTLQRKPGVLTSVRVVIGEV